MVYKYKRGGKRNAKGFMPKKTTPAKAPVVTKKAQVALIKSVIARVEETKYRSELTINSVPFNSQITNADVIPLLPKLAQQPNDAVTYEREGMKISPKKLRIYAEVCLTNVERSSALVVCYWVLTAKNVKHMPNLTLSNGINMGQLLRTGDAFLTQNFNGFVQDWSLPVNSAQFTVLKRGSFQLGKNTGQIQDSTTAGNQPIAQAVRHVLDFTLKTPATLTYDEDTDSPRTVLYPNSYAPFMVFGYYHQDQTTPDIVNQDIRVNLRSHLWYDDA